MPQIFESAFEVFAGLRGYPPSVEGGSKMPDKALELTEIKAPAGKLSPV
jgi:hypothetical protein